MIIPGQYDDKGLCQLPWEHRIKVPKLRFDFKMGEPSGFHQSCSHGGFFQHHVKTGPDRKEGEYQRLVPFVRGLERYSYIFSHQETIIKSSPGSNVLRQWN